MSARRTGYGCGAALVAGVLLRLLFFHFRPEVAGDALMYGDLAHNMVAHHVYGFSGKVIQPTLIRLPGYPLFLAACFAVFGSFNYLAALWLQMAIDLAGCALLGVLASRLAGRRAGLIALWLAVLCPFTANYSVVVLAESLSVFCVIAAFFSLERCDAQWRMGQRALGWIFVAGCAMSCAVLLRPDQGLLAAAIIAVMLWVGLRRGGQTRGDLRRGDLRRGGQTLASRLLPAIIVSLVIVLPLLVWTARNWRTFHVIQPLAPRYANDPNEAVPFGFQRWFRTWAIDYKATVDIYWAYDDTRMHLADLPPQAFDNAQQLEQTRTLFAQYNKVISATPEFDQAFAQIAAERIADHPLQYYLVLPIAREFDMWLRPRTALTTMPIDWWAVHSHPAQSTEEIAYALLNAAYLGLAIAGGLWWRRHAWGGRGAIAFAMIGFVVLRCLLLLTVDNSEPRYTLECFPIVIVLCSFAMMRARSDS